MAKDTRFRDKKEQKISSILPTDEHLTGRAGLALFVAYVRSIQILPLIDRWFGSMRKSSKGLAITELFVQLFCFFMDGTSRHITWFDHLKEMRVMLESLAAAIWLRLIRSSDCSASFRMCVDCCFGDCCSTSLSGDSRSQSLRLSCSAWILWC